MTFSTSPTYPIPGDSVTLTEDEPDGNEALFVLTAKPSRSELELGMLRTDDGEPTNVFVPDVEGLYTFEEQDYYKVTRFGEARRYLQVARDVPVYVGSVLDLPIRTVRGHDVTLRCTVVDSTVRAASFVDPTTDLARMLSSQITTTLEALVGTAVLSLGTSLITGVKALRAAAIAHFALTAGSVHAAADTSNVIRRGPPESIVDAIACLEEVADALVKHEQNYTTAIGLGTWHTNQDTLNALVSVATADVAGAAVRYADVAERLFERHRVQIASPTVHGAADNTNTLAASSALTALFVDYLDRVALEDPATLTGENAGSGDAQAKYGFTSTTF